jgi:hypothetical protein
MVARLSQGRGKLPAEASLREVLDASCRAISVEEPSGGESTALPRRPRYGA